MFKPDHPALLAFFFATCLFVSVPADALANMLVSNRTPRQGDTIEVVLNSPTHDGGVRGASDSNSNSDTNSGSGSEKSSENLTVNFNGHSYKAFPVLSESLDGAIGTVRGTSGTSDAGSTGGATSWSAEKKHLEYKALFAVPADLDPGKYSLKSGAETISLTVRAGIFPLQHIHLAPSKDNFDTAPGEEEAVERAKSTLSPERYWHGPFTAPSHARTSTGFGLKRMVNGRLLKDYFHSGLDYAGALGSPILATSGGKVVLVGRGFKLHGNTVAIDHGQGVISFYIHMKTIKVAEGEEVKSGQQIGTVGQTGRATGPHLHFSIYVNKVAANPSGWFTTNF
jgi:murein DD-endopeptidase MepM/ murein hydrolase activator NlpD